MIVYPLRKDATNVYEVGVLPREVAKIVWRYANATVKYYANTDPRNPSSARIYGLPFQNFGRIRID